MIMENVVKFNKHSSNKRLMDDLGIKDVDGVYELPVDVFISMFPRSNIVKLKCGCIACGSTYDLAVTDYMRKKHKEYCGLCLKTKILVGEQSPAYGKSNTKGIPKSEEHRQKLRGPRPHMCGDGNPNWSPTTQEFKRYKNKVHQLSHKIYQQNKTLINPENHPRTLAGVKEGWQLDHIKSIKQCFEEGVPPEQASSVGNLQMLPWENNIAKSTR